MEKLVIGQVRRILPFGEGETPPKVVLVHIIDTYSARVAQIGELKAGVYVSGYGYAQPWNTYSMGVEDMSEEVLTNVTPETVNEILKLEEAPIQFDSVGINNFMRMEIEVGSYYSIPSIFKMMEDQGL